MTQMYGKFALILALMTLLINLVTAQAGEPIPVLLNGENTTETQAWQDSLTAAFGDQELVWVEDEKDADIVLTSLQVMDGKIIEVDIRQNALQRLSPVLEAAQPGVLLDGEDVGVLALALWKAAHGDCPTQEEVVAADLEKYDGPRVATPQYWANCAIIAAYQSDASPDEDVLRDLARNFDVVGTGWVGLVNQQWLRHKVGNARLTVRLFKEQIDRAADSGTAADEAFWYGKRAQFYALNFDYQAALADLDLAIEADPENPYYPTLKGEVYLLLYEWNNAKAAFDAAIALGPDFALAYFQRGILLSTMTDIEGANADFAMYLALEPRGVYAEMAQQYMVGG